MMLIFLFVYANDELKRKNWTRRRIIKTTTDIFVTALAYFLYFMAARPTLANVVIGRREP
jgi:hypothetical protein